MKYLCLLSCLFLLLGCAAPAPEQEGCNECLENAFVNCEKYKDMWEGKHGDWTVQILGQKGNACTVFVDIPDGDLEISGKSMQCDVPLNEEAEFDIQDDCIGSLKDHFSE